MKSNNLKTKSFELSYDNCVLAYKYIDSTLNIAQAVTLILEWGDVREIVWTDCGYREIVWTDCGSVNMIIDGRTEPLELICNNKTNRLVLYETLVEWLMGESSDKKTLIK